MRYIYPTRFNKSNKSPFTIVVVYSNNPEREYFYHKYFSSSDYAHQHVSRKILSSKVRYCYYLEGHVNSSANKEPVKPKDALVALDKPNYFRDSEGYKYYINGDVKIKSKTPVFNQKTK